MQPFILPELISKVCSIEYHKSIPNANECKRRAELLTCRQEQVLALMAGGHSTKEAAHYLGITHKTAHNHLDRAMTLLDIRPAIAAIAAFRRAQEATSVVLEVVPELEPEEEPDIEPSVPWYWRPGGKQSPTAWAATDSTSEADGRSFKVIS